MLEKKNKSNEEACGYKSKISYSRKVSGVAEFSGSLTISSLEVEDDDML